MTRVRSLVSIPLVLMAAVLIAGCTTQIDVDKAEKEIASGYEKQVPDSKVKKVTCPDEIDGEKGTKAVCKMTLADGTTGDISVKVTSDDGDIRWDVVDPSSK